jgi:hypothetical protein
MSLTSFDIEPVSLIGELTAPINFRRILPAHTLHSPLGVGGEQLIKRVLGHADGSVTAIYNRYGYVKEMREVLERWAEDLMGGEFDPASIFSEPETVPYVIVEETDVA